MKSVYFGYLSVVPSHDAFVRNVSIMQYVLERATDAVYFILQGDTNLISVQ
jgi:hypothetical protein